MIALCLNTNQILLQEEDQVGEQDVYGHISLPQQNQSQSQTRRIAKETGFFVTLCCQKKSKLNKIKM